MFSLNFTFTRMQPIKILTYNIEQYYYNSSPIIYNSQDVLTVLQNSGADIIGLQEAEGPRIHASDIDGIKWFAKELGMYYFIDPNSKRTQVFGVGLLSRWPIIKAIVIHLPANDPGRVAIVVEVSSPTGTITILNTHFQTYDQMYERYSEVEKLIQITNTLDKAIILGDFNTPPFPTDNTFIKLNSTYQDSWTLSSSSLVGAMTFPSDNPIYRIDYIWLWGDLNVQEKSCGTIGNPLASDHLGYYCTIN